MERWTALLPDQTRSSTPVPSQRYGPKVKLVGRLPEEAWVVVLQYLPIPDLPQLALCNRRLSLLAKDDRVWRAKLAWLDYRGPGEVKWRDREQQQPAEAGGAAGQEAVTDGAAPAKPPEQLRSESPVFETSDDEFGDFFEGGKGEGAGKKAEKAGGQYEVVGDDGFGDFQDGAFDVAEDEDPFAIGEDFADIALDAGPAKTEQKKKDDDLLLMFDDDDVLPSIPAHAPVPTKPTTGRRPPPVSQLTFDTPAHRPSPPSTATRSAFAFNPSSPSAATPTTPHAPSFDLLPVFKKHHSLLLPFYTSLITHTTSSLVFSTSSLTPMLRAQLLASLVRFCNPLVAPTRSLPQRQTVLRNAQSAMDFFESALIAEFEKADAKKEEEQMKDKAKVLWQLNQSSNVAQVFVQRREIFYDTSHNPLKNLTKVETINGTMGDGIDFTPMDLYMQTILTVLSREGSLIARVFPPDANVLLYFLERIANDVVSEYITQLLSAAQLLANPLFLLATAATFGQVYRMVDCVVGIEPGGKNVTKERAEDVVFKMFEPLMDDYLSEEGEWIREVLEGMCREWDEKTAHDLAISDPTFLASSNPAQVKKNVLAGFTKVLLLPVTIIPKTAELGLNAITYGATGAFNTFASLGTTITGGLGGVTTSTSVPPAPPHARQNSTTSVKSVDSTPALPPVTPISATVPIESSAGAWGGSDDFSAPARLSIDASGTISAVDASSSSTPPSSAVPPTPVRRSRFDRMQLLLSLDTALQLIQADRDSLKRIQTFVRYPGAYGRKVRDAIEEVFIVLLQVLGEKHVGPAFEKASMQMERYKPEEHEEDGGRGGAVAPLVQFFELVHIGDTIQQMVDVYFEKEMAVYIDKKDFLNTVVREKKKFESSLDDAVAQGLNAAVNILMTQVEHLVTTRQGARDFCPAEGDDDFDLMPTKACKDVVEVLRSHTEMLRGSADKQIIEVFNQEVGIRLHGILLKHLKRMIVSTSGGLQLIADLNAYHQFVVTLRQSQVTAYFTSLKMVGEIYLVEDPKDLGALVRDAGRYEGTLSPEDLFELVQRRADWKKIERQVERAVFGLKLADDCCVS
ncbi:hypothetical protein JCM8547_001899 [Rhodosporidiobolus lusitaniae]